VLVRCRLHRRDPASSMRPPGSYPETSTIGRARALCPRTGDTGIMRSYTMTGRPSVSGAAVLACTSS
jgi:hypothetical protein